MLLYKNFAANLFDQVTERGLPVYGVFPTNGVVFSDVNLNASKGLTFLNLGNRIIKGAASANYGAVVNFSPPSVGLSGATGGTHSASGSNPSATPSQPNYVIGTTGTRTTLLASSGSHLHTINNVWSGAVDLPRRYIGVFSAPGSRYIPTDCWVLSGSLPNGNFSAISSDLGYLASASTTGAINTLSSTSSTWTLSTSSAGGHTHLSGSQNIRSGSGDVYYTAGSTDGAHSHSPVAYSTWTVQNYINLKSWRSNADDNLITTGTIIGWASTSTSLPPGWYFCDGGTYNGYTTPNINNNVHIKSNNVSEAHGATSTGTDTLEIIAVDNLFNSGSHLHGLGAVSIGLRDGSSGGEYHSSFSTGWSHAHSWVYTATGISISSTPKYTDGPSSYGLPFIIYLP